MKAKKYLKQLQIMDAIIKQKQQQLKALQCIRIPSMDYTKDKVQTSLRSEAAFCSDVEKLIELQNEMNCYIQKRDNMIQQIQSLGEWQHIDVLYKRYVQLKDFKNIAFEMCYTYDYVRKLHRNALKEFEKFT